ncbi:MAG TPA: hypothetical protein VJA66_03455 [Thermoanaerobaculia bacterium]
MRKILALSAVAAFCIAVVALAGDDKVSGHEGHHGKGGTITKVDTAGKMMMVKGSDGKETAVYWNDSTKVEGDQMKEGMKVHYKGESKDGKMTASWVHVGEMKKM